MRFENLRCHNFLASRQQSKQPYIGGRLKHRQTIMAYGSNRVGCKMLGMRQPRGPILTSSRLMCSGNQATGVNHALWPCMTVCSRV